MQKTVTYNGRKPWTEGQNLKIKIFACIIIFALIYALVILLFRLTELSNFPESMAFDFTEIELLDISNVDASIPRYNIVGQDIIYVLGIPVLFETFIDGQTIVRIASLLEWTGENYRIIEPGEPVPHIMPDGFADYLNEIMNDMDLAPSNQIETE
ncbi:MAG: hypothetical protein FWG65_00695 [Turicibacter sp.]|nr:hypothetical protein [Turicibacter sp.]